MQNFVFLLALVATSAARAEDVYVIMHTDGPADGAVHDAIRSALADRGLPVKLAPTLQELASGLQATACTNDVDVCALAVGRALGGTHVIVSRATSKDGAAHLEMSFHDLHALTIVRHTQAGTHDELRRWARNESLTFAKLELRGTLLIAELGAGAMVLLDDGDVIAMPMAVPVALPVGVHQLEARIDDGPVYKQNITIEAQVETIVRLCANGSYVAPCESASAVTPAGPGALHVVGIVATAAGAVGIGVGVAMQLLSPNEQNIDTRIIEQRIGVGSYVAGAALFGVAVVSFVVSAVTE
jgi:hypothetical protein